MPKTAYAEIVIGSGRLSGRDSAREQRGPALVTFGQRVAFRDQSD